MEPCGTADFIGEKLLEVSLATSFIFVMAVSAL